LELSATGLGWQFAERKIDQKPIQKKIEQGELCRENSPVPIFSGRGLWLLLLHNLNPERMKKKNCPLLLALLVLLMTVLAGCGSTRELCPVTRDYQVVR
jgi:hypothetical protein